MMLVLCLLSSCTSYAQGTYDFSAYPYLYSRPGIQWGANDTPVSVLAVGDFVPGESLENTRQALNKNSDWLKSADLTLLNLEGTPDFPELIQPEPSDPAYAPYQHLISPEIIPDLKSAGVDLLNLANNHTFESGVIGLAGSIKAIERAGLEPLGVIKTKGNALPIVKTIHGIRLAFLAFTTLPPPGLTETNFPRPSVWDDTLSPEIVQTARDKADVVIISIHWGLEYHQQVDPLQKQIAHKLAEAGADLVIGHHPHVIQGNQLFDSPRKSFTAYSLGNFLFEQSIPETQNGLALRAIFDRDGLISVQAIPLQAGSTPGLQTPREAQAILSKLELNLPHQAFTCDTKTCRSTVSPAPVPQGIFTSAAIDLTGDGQPEQVSLQGGGVHVLQNNTLAWQSEAGWQVLDLAIGDPNDDGRNELLLALRKPDTQGKLQSQPFIIGWRNGQYRTLWGGSPVSEPIQEVELGEIDGDLPQELVVVDEVVGKGESTISVWDWHGWGFSLKWRSPPGRYQDLKLLRDSLSQNLVISVGYLP